MLRFSYLFVLLLGSTSCVETLKVDPVSDDPYYAPIYPEAILNEDKSGSLYSDYNESSLYTDIKAHRVGDIISVLLKEKTNASKDAKNTSNSSTNIESPFYNKDSLEEGVDDNDKKSHVLGLDVLKNFITELKDERKFDAKAGSEQRNKLDGSISVNVMEVMPNGNLVIRGEKWITINDGQEFIRLTGIVRPQDISNKNEVLSSKVANARIEYSGTGSMSSAQKAGWLSRFFMSKWWLF